MYSSLEALLSTKILHLRDLVWVRFDLHGEEILLVLQHLEKLLSPKARCASLYYSSQNFPSTCEEEFRIFLELLKALQTAITANIAEDGISMPKHVFKNSCTFYAIFIFIASITISFPHLH